MGTNGYQQIFRKPEKVLWGNTLCDTLSSHPGEPNNTTSCFKLQKTEKSSSMISLPAHSLNFENSLLPYYNNKLVLTEIKQQFSKLLLKTTQWNFSFFWKDAEIFSAHPGRNFKGNFKDVLSSSLDAASYWRYWYLLVSRRHCFWCTAAPDQNPTWSRNGKCLVYCPLQN